jgi:hypothetical protein
MSVPDLPTHTATPRPYPTNSRRHVHRTGEPMNLIIPAAVHGCRAVTFDWDGTLADTHQRNYQVLCDDLAPHEISIDPGARPGSPPWSAC